MPKGIDAIIRSGATCRQIGEKRAMTEERSEYDTKRRDLSTSPDVSARDELIVEVLRQHGPEGALVELADRVIAASRAWQEARKYRVKLAIERNRARRWSALWKRAAKLNRQACLSSLLPGVNRIWHKRGWFYRRPVKVVYEDDLVHFCGQCGRPMEIVRPGKWQCSHCE